MGSVWIGKKLKISLFGESHGKEIGVVIDNFPAGFALDEEYIVSEMMRRRPNKTSHSTSRDETDVFEILSGVFQCKTTGAPICAVIKNKDHKSADYEKTKNLLRPGHADYPAYKKYDGYNDYRGGGHFSGRLTAPLVFAGALCSNYLKNQHNIEVFTKIDTIGGVHDTYYDENDYKKTYALLKDLKRELLPILSSDIKAEIIKKIDLLASEGNSVGGAVKTYIYNMPAGIGDPFFSSIESEISRMIFSIPAIKGVSFGAGESFSTLTGKESNDEYYISGGKIYTYSNNNGGITGGISNGAPIVFKSIVKATSSISLEQRTVNIAAMKDDSICVKGRHDACIVPRVIPVIDNASAIVIADFLI